MTQKHSLHTYSCVLMTALGLLTSAAHGQFSSKLKNNAAIRELEEGNVEAAEDKLGQALELDAGDPVILYNWASMNLHSVSKAHEKANEDAANKNGKKNKDALSEEQKKKVEASHIEFEKFLKSDPLPSHILTKEVFFQNALALEMLGNNKDALKNYYQSLNAENAGLDDAALRQLTEKTQINISRLLIKSQSSSSGQGGGGGEGDKSSESKEGDGEGSDQSKGQGQGSGEGQQRSKQEPEFGGTDVNESQAQQILNSVSNQDRQVQQRKGQQQSKQNMQNGEEGQPSSRDHDKPW